MSKKVQTKFAFDCPYTAQELKERLPEILQKYCQKTGMGVLLEKEENGFLLGLERCGHSQGYWYQAQTQDTEFGCKIRGAIELFPKEEYREKDKKRKKWGRLILGIVFIIPIVAIFILFSLVWLLMLGWNFLVDLFTNKKRNRVKKQWNMAFPPSKEQILREVMQELGCKEIEE